MSKSILVIDDEASVCWALERALRQEGHAVRVAATAEDGLRLAREHAPSAILLDVRLPGMDGITALEQFRQIAPGAAVVIMTAFGDLDTAVKAVAGGAFDYLTKPFDLKQVLDAVGRALSRQAIPLPEPLATAGSDELVGHSPAMQLVFKRIALVAARDASVLITGESGTGKELVARAIHRHSARRDKPFLPVHIAALNPALVESELFGHVKGAFTGATQTRPGLLQLAQGGTVFLDELGDIPASVQVKLLRVLEHQEVLPVGGTSGEPLDLRILAATHQDLGEQIALGTFRHDLFFRLNVFPIHLPPLRDRQDDIVLLAEHFLRQLNPAAASLPAETIAMLRSRDWPGNVRELRNALAHADILARGGPLLPEHFPPSMAESANGSQTNIERSLRDWAARELREPEPDNLYSAMLAKVEPALFKQVLEAAQGNRVQAARWLGLNRTTLRKKLRQHGMDA